MGRLIQNNLISSATHTTSGASSDLNMIGVTNVRLLLAVTNVSGTSPILDVTISGKTKAGNYVTYVNFTQITAASSQSVEISRIAPTIQISWVISGMSPSFTFEVD